jgi:hypothetical protein
LLGRRNIRVEEVGKRLDYLGNGPVTGWMLVWEAVGIDAAGKLTREVVVGGGGKKRGEEGGVRWKLYALGQKTLLGAGYPPGHTRGLQTKTTTSEPDPADKRYVCAVCCSTASSTDTPLLSDAADCRELLQVSGGGTTGSFSSAKTTVRPLSPSGCYEQQLYRE